MKQIRSELLFFSDIKYVDCGRAHYHCDPICHWINARKNIHDLEKLSAIQWYQISCVSLVWWKLKWLQQCIWADFRPWSLLGFNKLLNVAFGGLLRMWQVAYLFDKGLLKCCNTDLVTSGSHCAVRLGHSKACVITRSYRNGVFFFHILYSSFMTRSSTASSKPPGVQIMHFLILRVKLSHELQT